MSDDDDRLEQIHRLRCTVGVLIVAGIVAFVGLAWVAELGRADRYRAEHHCIQLFGQWFSTETLTDLRYCQ